MKRHRLHIEPKAAWALACLALAGIVAAGCAGPETSAANGPKPESLQPSSGIAPTPKSTDGSNQPPVKAPSDAAAKVITPGPNAKPVPGPKPNMVRTTPPKPTGEKFEPKVVENGGLKPVEVKEGGLKPPSQQEDVGNVKPGTRPKALPVQTAPSAEGSKTEASKKQQPQKPKRSPQQRADWKTSSMSFAVLGPKIDQAFRGLRSAVGKNRTFAELPDGAGTSEMDMVVVDSTKFRLEYPAVDRALRGQIAVADGKQVTVFNGSTWSTPVPVKNVTNFNSQQVVDAWPTRFAELTFAPLSRNGAVWTALSKGLGAGLNGFAVKVEERTVTMNNRPQKFYRVKAESSRLKTTIVIVIDAQRNLPVTVSCMGPKRDVNMTIGWNFGGQLPKTSFSMPPRDGALQPRAPR